MITNQQSTVRYPYRFCPLATLSYRTFVPTASVPCLVPFIIGAETLDQ